MLLHADSDNFDQSGRMHRLICVFAGRNDHFGFVMRRLMYTLQLSRLASRVSDCRSSGRWFDSGTATYETEHAHFFTDRKRQLSDG